MDPSTELPKSTLLKTWLTALGYEVLGAENLAGDVSPRRYFRLDLGGGKTAILAYYPSDLEETCARFEITTRLLEGLSVPVPAILGSNCAAGFMLLEDLGASTLYDRQGEDWSSLVPYFEQSISLWRRIRGLPLQSALDLNPALDRDLLIAELRQTWEIYLTPRQLTGSPDESRLIWQALTEVCEHLSNEPQVVCHRDFMARNLVPMGPSYKVGVLDHQDLRAGPPFYDLASLLNDSLFPPPETENALLASCLSDDSERLSYHRAAVQRTIKVVGTFEAFARRGNPARLPLIPATLGRALYHLQRVPEGQGITQTLSELWRPILGA
jgi:aminoglycoside/choline kinase family phosphotransferase